MRDTRMPRLRCASSRLRFSRHIDQPRSAHRRNDTFRSLDATKWNRGPRCAIQKCLDCAALHRGYDRHDPLISRDQRIAGTTHAVASMQRSGIEGTVSDIRMPRLRCAASRLRPSRPIDQPRLAHCRNDTFSSLDATKWNRGSRSAKQECLDCAALHRGYDFHDPLISRDQRIAATTPAVASMQRSGIEGHGARYKNASIALRCIEATTVTTNYAAASNASPYRPRCQSASPKVMLIMVRRLK